MGSISGGKNTHGLNFAALIVELPISAYFNGVGFSHNPRSSHPGTTAEGNGKSRKFAHNILSTHRKQTLSTSTSFLKVLYPPQQWDVFTRASR